MIEIRNTHIALMWDIYKDDLIIGKDYNIVDVCCLIKVCKETNTPYRFTDANL